MREMGAGNAKRLRMIGRFAGLVGLLAVLGAFVAPVWSSPFLPACAPSVQITGVRVVRVETNGVLVLQDGRAARLEGLLIPGSGGDRSSQQLALQVLRALMDRLQGQDVILAIGSPHEDRYGRLRAQVFVEENHDWVQLEMLRRGLARVSIAPDRRECAKELYAAEDAARRARTGIWTHPDYSVRPAANSLLSESDTFQIVTGKVVSAHVRNGRAYLDFGPSWQTDFAITISPEDMKNFREAGVDPLSYQGKTVRVRGWVETLRRPEIEVAAPEDIEVLNAD
jgi:endonuclease YncB( thermonuclease family)